MAAQTPLNLEDLYCSFDAADSIVLKKYINSLSDCPCIKISDDLSNLKIGTNIELFRVEQIVYDKDENIQDKLTTVYSSVFSIENSSIVMIIRGTETSAKLYIGLATKALKRGEKKALTVDDSELTKWGDILRDAIEGNFPGTKLGKVYKVKPKSKEEYREGIIADIFKDSKFISAVSSIPAMRSLNERKNIEFVQGLEKFVDTMRGKRYTAIILADTVPNKTMDEICAEYEDIYSQLSPFRSSSRTVSSQNSVTDTESIIRGVTDTTNKTLAKSLTHGTAEAKTKTDSVGGSISGGYKFVSASFNYNHAVSTTKSETNAETNTESSGSSKSLTEQNSVAKALSESSGEAIQLNYENRGVRTLLERIDEKIKRLRSCADYGMFDTCAYFVSNDYGTVVEASNAYKSITRGENSALESSAINIWKDKNAELMAAYLKRFYHPEFVPKLKIVKIVYNDTNGEKQEDNPPNDSEATKNMYPVTPAVLISGKEMAYQMPLPKKSLPGVPVLDCAEFGRNISSLSEAADKICIGKIYHMHKEEETEVKLNINNLTAHTFITGSTGSGKSTTIYKLIKELVDYKKKNIHFMVIEPAKGEYKNVLTNLELKEGKRVRVLGTNPKLTELLRINPFSFPSDKIHIYEHMDKLTEIFNVCWPLYAAMPAVLKAAIENAYRTAGWNLIKSENPHGDIFPTFVDVALEVEKYINKSEYSSENKSNYKGSLLTRLESLTNGINSLIFSSKAIPDNELFDENVIVDLSRVGSTETKALIMGMLILKLQEYRIAKAEAGDADLKHITVLEEAHNLLKRTSTEQSSETANLLGKSVEMLSNSIAEMRTYGEGFIIADQSPGLLDMSVIRNTNTKIIMRLPDLSDRELVGKAAGLNDTQIIELSKLTMGIAAVYQSDWISPVLCKISDPGITKTNYAKTTNYVEPVQDGVIFDLLDSKFRAQLDNASFEKKFRKTVLSSSVPTNIKLRLLDYLSERGTAHSTKILASLLFDYFQNSKNVLDSSINEDSVEDLKIRIMSDIQPSIMEYDDDQIDCLITLIIKEYRERYLVDFPIWHEFVSQISRRNII